MRRNTFRHIMRRNTFRKGLHSLVNSAIIQVESFKFSAEEITVSRITVSEESIFRHFSFLLPLRTEAQKYRTQGRQIAPPCHNRLGYKRSESFGSLGAFLHIRSIAPPTLVLGAACSVEIEIKTKRGVSSEHKKLKQYHLQPGIHHTRQP